MKITFLGTGTSQGVPVVACNCLVCLSDNSKDKRLRTSIMVEHLGQNLVIDSGPDFRQQMLREEVQKLDALLLTHEHKDHIAGLDDIRAFNYISKQKLDVYAVERVQEAVKREFHYIFSGENYPGIPKINLLTIHNQPFQAAGMHITPIEVLHYKLPVMGFRIQDFTYITDANFIGSEEMEKIRGSKVVVINALRHEKHISHFNLEEAIAILEDLKPKKAYLTHISHQLGLHDEINKKLPHFIKCAYDGLQIDLD